MAALIASPQTLHAECYVYLWQTKQKHTFVCSLSVFLLIKNKQNPHKTERNKGKTKDLGSLCPCGVDPSLLIYNSQFDIAQNSDTDYRHMICLGLAPVHRLGLLPALHRWLHVAVTEG